MAKVKVVIPDDRYIPTLGKGPFRKPFAISEEVLRMLQRMNYIVNVVNDNDDTTMETVTIDRGLAGAEPVESLQTVVAEDDEPVRVVIEGAPAEDEPKEEEIDVVAANAALFDEEELAFLKNDAKRSEITDFFDEKGVEYPSSAVIKDLLALVGLTR